jgi:tight adherence protein B
MTSIAVFLAATAGALVMIQVLFGAFTPDRTRVRRRLAREFGPRSDAPNLLYKEPITLSGDFAADPPAVPDGWTWSAVPDAPTRSFRERIEDALGQAAVPMTPQQFLWAVAGAGLIPAAGGAWLGGGFGGVLGLVVGCAVPILVLDARIKARRERLQKQLVGAFELMARVLRSGQSVSEALRGAVEAFDEPLATEFAGCLHQMGLRQDEALRGLVKPSSVIELRLFVTAMTIHRQTGGNLSDVLDRLATLVRARLVLKQRIRTLTAEGRLQSTTLVVLPAVTFAVMFFLNRQYAEQLLGQVRLLLATGAFMGVGVLWIRNILSFEG